MKKFIPSLVLSLFFLSGSFAQISPGQISDFEDGTVQGWSNGPTAFNQPENIQGGGPGGADDNFLRDISDGNGSGGKLVVFNQEPEWLGNYLAEGIQRIRFFARTPTGEPLTLRVGLRGGPNNTRVASVMSASIPPVIQDWVLYDLSIAPEDLQVVSGPDSVEEVLSDVSQIRIVHNPEVAFGGVNIIAFMHLDDIEASTNEGVLGATDNSSLQVNVFPNPVQERLGIRSNLPVEQFRLLNVLGQVVMEGRLNSEPGFIDLAGLESGIYLLELEAGSFRSTQRVIKR